MLELMKKSVDTNYFIKEYNEIYCYYFFEKCKILNFIYNKFIVIPIKDIIFIKYGNFLS